MPQKSVFLAYCTVLRCRDYNRYHDTKIAIIFICSTISEYCLLLYTMILIIDDDDAIRASLTFLLKRSGLSAKAVPGPKEALDEVRLQEPELILMDMNYSLSTSGEEGLELLRKIKIFAPSAPVILMTAWGSISLAVEGMRLGAFDFITKPWDNLALMERIRTALHLGSAQQEDKGGNAAGRGFDRIIGRSPLMKEVLDAVTRVAPTGASVLITGESGTGKELIAEAIHLNSPRADGPFVKVNLGGLSSSLFDSEMFGHRKGAFTDAWTDRKGRFELADKGTIFLDEIGELEPVCQVKLLRVLQDRTYEPLGESIPRRTDVRVVSATNRDLHAMVRQGLFREDLFYRLNLIPIHLPPLRERREDIPLLVQYFTRNTGSRAHFSPDAMEYLSRLPYPGNIRELKNIVERSLILGGSSGTVSREDVIRCTGTDTEQDRPAASAPAQTLEEMERGRILRALSDCNGNVTRAAASLGITRASLYRRIEKYRINL